MHAPARDPRAEHDLGKRDRADGSRSARQGGRRRCRCYRNEQDEATSFFRPRLLAPATTPRQCLPSTSLRTNPPLGEGSMLPIALKAQHNSSTPLPLPRASSSPSRLGCSPPLGPHDSFPSQPPPLLSRPPLLPRPHTLQGPDPALGARQVQHPRPRRPLLFFPLPMISPFFERGATAKCDQALAGCSGGVPCRRGWDRSNDGGPGPSWSYSPLKEVGPAVGRVDEGANVGFMSLPLEGKAALVSGEASGCAGAPALLSPSRLATSGGALAVLGEQQDARVSGNCSKGQLGCVSSTFEAPGGDVLESSASAPSATLSYNPN